MPSEVGGVELFFFVVEVVLCVDADADADAELVEPRPVQIVCTLGRERSSGLTTTVGLEEMEFSSFEEIRRRKEATDR